MRHRFPWPAAAALAVRLIGIAAVIGVISYMSGCYLSGQYLRDDPALTLIAIMLFVLGAVFAVYCAAEEATKRLKESRNLTKNDFIQKGCIVMNGTMRAIVKEKPEVGATYRTDVPIPQITSDEVLVKVRATAICGTDQHIYKWAPYAQERLKLPMVFGHEFAGDIVEVGGNVTGFQIGDRVAGETHIPCNDCFQCRTGNQHVCENMKIIGVHVPGSFGEYINVHKDCLWKLDDSVSYVKGSLLEPMGVGVHGISVTPMGGKDVLITGCGPIGLMAIAAAKFSGAGRLFVTDIDDPKLEVAKKMGADVTINTRNQKASEVVLQATGGRGVDAVIDYTGNNGAISDAFKALKLHGQFTMVGLPGGAITLDATSDIIYKEATVVGVTGREMYKTWFECEKLLKTPGFSLEPALGGIYPLEKFEDAFSALFSGAPGKMVLTLEDGLTL